MKKNNNLEKAMKDLEYGNLKAYKKIFNVDREIEFTQIYKKYENEHPYVRETACLRAQTKTLFLPIEDGDYFAGRIDRPLVGIDQERGGITDAAFFCQFQLLKDQLNNEDLSLSAKKDIDYLLNYWSERVTHIKCREAFSEELKLQLPDDDYYSAVYMSYPMYGLGGPCLDYDKLLKLGIPGLTSEIKEKIAEVKLSREVDIEFLNSLLQALDIFVEVASTCAEEALIKSANCQDKTIKARYSKIALSLQNICKCPPKNYHEGIQLFWIYSLMALPRNYGRMDVYLGDFLAKDLEMGILSKEEAFELTCGLWKLIIARTDNFNNRIIIGGRGRRNEKNADLFADLALDVQNELRDTIPQLSLRYYEGMKESLWSKALDVIQRGSNFPILYNDDVNIPAAQKAMKVTLLEAEQYVMYGCGEFIIDHKSIGSPDAALNVLKVLDVTLHNGVDSYTGIIMGLALGKFDTFKTFEELKAAVSKQIKYQVKLLAQAQDTIYKVTGEAAAFPFLSLLYDNCIETAKPLMSGGVQYLAGTLESFGNNTASDALYAIKKTVYDNKLITHNRLLECIDSNFEGNETERRILKALPKYGNDNDEVDEISLWLNNVVCVAAQMQSEATSLHSFNVVLVNNGDSVLFGKAASASTDGRGAGEPVSNGNQPGAGNDQNGLTALLNSMSKLDSSKHAGATHNLKVSKDMLKNKPEVFNSLIKGYFKNGGSQLMITVADAKELRDALSNPEKHRNLIVRVGGYSDRFVDLPKEVQQEVVRRTTY